jgi:glycosyltransferase involved in cell wall biosynthesis
LLPSEKEGKPNEDSWDDGKEDCVGEAFEHRYSLLRIFVKNTKATKNVNLIAEIAEVMVDLWNIMKRLKELSVFFPTYNEESNIKDTVEKALKVLPNVANKWELLIINDGSTDKTAAIANALSKKDKRIRVITHNPNRGYGAALKSGFYGAKYEWIVFNDSDGQFDFSEITKFIEKQEETNADIVIGYYLERKVPLYRKLNTFLWETIVFILFGLKVRDIDCAFKLVHKKVIEKIPPLESERGAFISSEFLIKVRRAKFKIAEVGVHHFAATRKGTGANLNVIIKSFIDLFSLWKKLR